MAKDKRFSVAMQAYRKGQVAGQLEDVTQVMVAADTLDEAKKTTRKILGKDLDGREIRVSSVMEFAAKC